MFGPRKNKAYDDTIVIGEGKKGGKRGHTSMK